MSGVVQTIKAHFEKHPLAVVNVKGRAKGTSVQELVFKLEVHMQKIPIPIHPLLFSSFANTHTLLNATRLPLYIFSIESMSCE